MTTASVPGLLVIDAIANDGEALQRPPRRRGVLDAIRRGERLGHTLDTIEQLWLLDGINDREVPFACRSEEAVV